MDILPHYKLIGMYHLLYNYSYLNNEDPEFLLIDLLYEEFDLLFVLGRFVSDMEFVRD